MEDWGVGEGLRPPSLFVLAVPRSGDFWGWRWVTIDIKQIDL